MMVGLQIPEDLDYGLFPAFSADHVDAAIEIIGISWIQTDLHISQHLYQRDAGRQHPSKATSADRLDIIIQTWLSNLSSTSATE